jgi:hypothetical protein
MKLGKDPPHTRGGEPSQASNAPGAQNPPHVRGGEPMTAEELVTRSPQRRKVRKAVKRKPEFIITWGRTALSDAGYHICGSAKSKAEAMRKIRECDTEPGSAKGHRLYVVREIRAQ